SSASGSPVTIRRSRGESRSGSGSLRRGSDMGEVLSCTAAGQPFAAHRYSGEEAVGDHACACPDQPGGLGMGLDLAQGGVEQLEPMREVTFLEAGNDHVLEHWISRELAAVVQHRAPEPLHPAEGL